MEIYIENYTSEEGKKLNSKSRQGHLLDDPGGYRSIICKSDEGVADCWLCCSILLRLMK